MTDEKGSGNTPSNFAPEWLRKREAGSGKRIGYAVAMNASGDITSVDLDDIYIKAAAKFGVPSDSISKAKF